MSGSAFPALLQLACSINMLVGCMVHSSQVVSGVNLDQISVLPGSCSRYLPAQMRNLSGFWSKFFLHSSEVFGNTSEVGFGLG